MVAAIWLLHGASAAGRRRTTAARPDAACAAIAGRSPLDTPHEAEIPLKTTGHNISSDAVDQAEISKIADELKAGLGRPAPERAATCWHHRRQC